MKRDSDLSKAFQFMRRNWASGGAYGGPGGKPRPALIALEEARKALAALPALEEAAKAARAALEVQRGIDCRRYAPAWVKASEEAAKARKALQAGQAWRYAGPVWKKGGRAWPQSEKGLFFFETEEQGLRNSQAACELIKLDHTGWYADSYQENLCGGLVAQLPSRKGKARFVAGYQFSQSDNGLGTFDLARIFEADLESERETARRQIGKAYWRPEMESPGYWNEAAQETARKEAAKAADSMAESAAEKEREYQEANSAGYSWAEKKAGESELRREALAILAERRAARAINPAGFPALCAALRGKVESLWEEIQESRKEREALADSVYGKDGRAAFCDGAGLQAFPS